MNSSNTGTQPTDSKRPLDVRRPPTRDETPSELVEFVETPPQGVTAVAEPARTISDFVETESGVPINDWPLIPNPLKQPARCVFWLGKSLFCIAVMIGLLAIVAAIPIASVFVLGYLLEVEGRIARSGRLRDGFPLLSLTPRIGSIIVGVAIWLMPLFFFAGMAADAALIDPNGASAGKWQTAKLFFGVLIAIHLCLALARGGSFGCFFRPIKNLRWFLAELRNRTLKGKTRCPECGEAGDESAEHCSLCGYTPDACAHCGEQTLVSATQCAMCGTETATPDETSADQPRTNLYWHRADRKVRKFVQRFRLKHHFQLGFQGMVGALAILLIPTLLFAAANRAEGPLILLTVLGGLCLTIVFLYVPFLQARLAAESRRGAMFELREVRKLYTHAPIAWFLALLIVYALALPLYLFTAFALPNDAMWLLTLVFVMSIYPARVVAGWAYARAARKQREGKPMSHWVFRHGCRLLMFTATAAYTLFFFFARDLGVQGRLVLFEHHAFLGTTLSSVFARFP